MLVVIVALSPLNLVRSSLKDNCIFSCRYRAAQRLPSWRPPLSLAPCALAAGQRVHCRARNVTAQTTRHTIITAPRFVVALATLPPQNAAAPREVGGDAMRRGVPLCPEASS